ncbi:MAG: (2Fe-2S)-binding protein [Vicinamibacteria bacterium]|nr:(2Fe-2S)-binding protein [Vicinamibacteria bacterium]
MPKCTIDGKEIEVAPGTSVIQAAEQAGVRVPRFCYHDDLPVDGNCRMCMVEIEKFPKLQIACGTPVSEGMVIKTQVTSEKAKNAQKDTLEFLLVNHPIDCPVCDQAGECYLQDQYMDHGLHDSRIVLEDKIQKRKVVDIGPILLDAERCVVCSRCLRYEREVTKTNLLEFVNRGGSTQISTYNGGSITHEYAGNLVDVCPVGALLSKDFRFKMRVWFLKETDSICPGCSTGCNMTIDHRDGEAYRFRPRRNVEVNKSWMCDPGRDLYKTIGSGRVTTAHRTGGAVAAQSELIDEMVAKLQAAGAHSAFLASPRASNEDAFAFKKLALVVGGRLDFRVGNPQDKVKVRKDEILQREDRHPNTQGLIDLGLGVTGVEALLGDCKAGKVQVLVLQDGAMLQDPAVAEAAKNVAYVAAMATHQGSHLSAAHAVLPAAMWVETDGTFTNFDQRVQRFKRAFEAPGDAKPRWEIALDLLARLGKPMNAATAGDVFVEMAVETKAYADLTHRGLGPMGRGQGDPAKAQATA